MDDVGALRSTVDDLGVPVLVERSRSGDRAHLWIVFSRPLPARDARRLASLLLTLAMQRRSIAMSSYDRLFPNQDSMPRGGFGNLIALPPQRERRADGCTVFLDGALEPYPDQWLYLAGVPRMDADRVHEMAAEAHRSGRTLVLVHRRPLAEQWAQRLSEFLGLDAGAFGSPATSPGSSGIDVAMVQTLVRRDDLESAATATSSSTSAITSRHSRSNGCCAISPPATSPG